MFGKRRGFRDSLRHEIIDVCRFLSRIIPAMIVGAALIFVSWLYFGGPCRVSLFFKIPGGGFTIAAYFVLWFIIFALAGAETVLILRSCNRYTGDRTLLYHIASHMCLLLWYPLFFTTFSQFLALPVIIAATVVLILEGKEASRSSSLLPVLFLGKAIVAVVFVYINFVFLIIN